MLRMLFLKTLFFLCILSGSAFASPGKNYLKGEYLYLLPMVSESYYAVPAITSNQPFGDRQNNEFHFKSAYRLEGQYACANLDIQLTWTHMPQVGASNQLSGFSVAILGTPNDNAVIFSLAESHRSLSYYALEANLVPYVFQTPCTHFSIAAGLQYYKIGFKEKVSYFSVNSSQNRQATYKNNTRGIGPIVKCVAHYFLPCKIFRTQPALVGTLKGGILASRYNTDFFSIRPFPTPGTIIANNKTRWDLVPFSGIDIGLSACFSKFIVELGYEMFMYSNGIDHIRFVDDFADGTSLDIYSNASFQGPYASLQWIF